jgi:hypothetical protein
MTSRGFPFMCRSTGRAARFGLILLLGCTYGPEEHQRTISATTIDPRLTTIGVLVMHSSVRQPSGISTFPDGGAAKRVYRDVTLYFADVFTATVREVATIAVPASMQASVGTGFLGWSADTAYFELGSCGPNDGCTTAAIRTVYRAPVTGGVQAVAAAPSGLTSIPNTVTAWGDTVSLRANTHDVHVFALSDERKLVPARHAPAASQSMLGSWASDKWQLNLNPSYGILRSGCARITLVEPVILDATNSFRVEAVGERFSASTGTPVDFPSVLSVVGHVVGSTNPRTLHLSVGSGNTTPPRGFDWADTMDVIEGRVLGVSCPNA